MDDYADKFQKLGAAIARCREEEGISQVALSRMLGHSSHSHLSRIENGHSAPSVDLLFEIAEALDVKVAYFFTDI